MKIKKLITSGLGAICMLTMLSAQADESIVNMQIAPKPEERLWCS